MEFENIYIEKRWSKEVIEKRLENLKKIIPPSIVDAEIRVAKVKADDELDALYLAYYSLKDSYCKIKRKTFGIPKNVKYTPKRVAWYSNDWSACYDNTEYFYPPTTASTSATIYTYNANDYFNTWATTLTTTILNR